MKKKGESLFEVFKWNGHEREKEEKERDGKRETNKKGREKTKRD